MRYAGFRPRTPALERRAGYYNQGRVGYPTNPEMEVPEIRGGQVLYAPYPSRMWPEPEEVIADVQCPEGMSWSQENRRCVVNTPQYSGLGAIARTAASRGARPADWTNAPLRTYSRMRAFGGYLDPALKEEWSWDSFGVGLGAMAATMTLGVVASMIMQMTKGKKGSADPRLDMSLLPSFIPALGAGVIAYLLRWNMNRPCGTAFIDQGPEVQEIPAFEAVTQQPGFVLAARTECPEGFQQTANGCEELI